VTPLRQLCLIGLVTVLALGTAGCRRGPFVDGTRGNIGGDIQDRVERFLERDETPKSGSQRWSDVQSSDYQSMDLIDRLRGLDDSYKQRLEDVRRIMSARPVTLDECMVLSLEFNNDVQARRAEMTAVGGQKLVVQSRFVPQLDYKLDLEHVDDSGSGVGGAVDHRFGLSKTILEFGRDNRQDVLLRQDQRDALFSYEDSVQRVLADVRLTFFTILLRQRQLDERSTTLEGFKSRFEQIQRKEAERRTPQLDVLTARLNVLDEELRINALQREVHRRQADLLRFLGLPIALIDVQLEGALEDFELDVERAVRFALERSTRVAQARATVWEQKRIAKQIGWENAPEIDLRAGYRNERVESGVGLQRDDRGTFGLSGFAEGGPDKDDPNLADDGDFPDATDDGLFAKLRLTVPLFDGFESKGKRIRELARLERVRHELRGVIDQVEVEVRQAYQTVLERELETKIQKQRVEISKRRLKVQEVLKEEGRISDDALETFRNRFFADQDEFFRLQIALVESQESLRSAMRYFERLPAIEPKG
jgi:outer membrane protein TolC